VVEKDPQRLIEKKIKELNSLRGGRPPMKRNI
jgi:hypothetical protein